MRISVLCLLLTVLAAQTDPSAAARAVDPTLPAIQDSIAAFDLPGGYYRTTYRYAEPNYWRHIAGWMRADAGRRKVSNILDIGCGYGTLLSLAVEMYGAKGYCMDVTPYVEKYAAAHGITFVKANIETGPVPWDMRFDMISMTEVLEHFNFYPVPTLKKIRASLAPGGRFFLSTPDAQTWGRVTKYYKSLKDMPQPDPARKIIDDHIWVYDKKELYQVLREAGFEVVNFQISKAGPLTHFNLELKAAD